VTVLENRLVCLFRSGLAEEGEYDIAAQHFRCVPRRSQCHSGDIVVGRYSVLPWYTDLYRDLEEVGATLIQTPLQHQWIANMDWAFDGSLRELTFPTWSGVFEAPRHEAPFVVKGRTNSKKQNWNELMFAETWEQASQIESLLMRDSLIGEQGVVVRKYVPLTTYFEAIGGVPITKEFRVFVFGDTVLSAGYYWHAFEGDLKFYGHEAPRVEEIPWDFVQQAIGRIRATAASPPVFYVIDIAEDRTGRWWVVEINDGMMSGLSANRPEVLYPRLREELLLWARERAI
jgi:hypothetical protein